MYQGGKPLEEKSKQSSSNYGSLSHAQGSSSSLSFSLSSMDDQPSTSGCSSDMAYGLRNNQVKKQKVKQYLRTLMSMVGPTSGRKMSTLSTLQHVVDSVRRITDPKNTPASQMCEMKNRNLPSSELDSRLLVKSSYDLTILVSMKKHVVHQVTPEMMLLLEYPLDFWKGRIITDFMYKRDLLTFNSNIVMDSDLDEVAQSGPDLSEDSQTGASDLPVKTFYIRFRSFKSIGKGFTLKRTACYKPFQVNLRMATAEHSGIETLSKHRKLMMLKCLPLESPYKENGELPEMRTFSMRHTMLSTVSHIHSNAIPLLGYLPQDVIGVSIFEIFHPDDLPVLHNVYKEVIESKGQAIKQSRSRMKARNGEWIVVDTEWSSFVDPWSKKLEFIMGQHTVVTAPRDINVFEENLAGNRFSAEQLLEAQKHQQLIRKLLNSEKTASEKVEARQETRRESSTGVDRHVRDKNFHVSDEEPTMNRETVEVCRAEDTEEESIFYNQLNYSQNIKRYLMSQCLPGSVQLTQTNSLPQTPDCDTATAAATAAATMEPTDFPVNIQFTKPPSYGSSTIVHVSEHREDTIPSPPQPPEIVEDQCSQIRGLNSFFGPTPLPPQVELTQEALRKHTKLQEKLLVQQAKQEDSILFLEKQKESGLKKRSLSDSGSQVNANDHGRPKMSKIDRGKTLESSAVPGDVFSTPFGIPMVPISTGNIMPPNISTSKSHPMFAPNPPPEFLSMQNIPMYMQQFPVMQVDPTTGIATPVMPVYSNTAPLEPSLKSQGIQWPYFQQTGVSFVPQVMGGFYQTLTGMFQPFPLPRMNIEMSESKCPTSMPVTSTTVTTPKTEQEGTPVVAADSSGPVESSRLDSSTGNDTDSSLMYILEASSSINNSSREDAMEKVKHVPPRKAKSKWFNPPSWLTAGKWTNDVKMQYQLPQRKLKNVLKADREALNKMDCGNSMVTDQLRELLDSVTQHNKVFDEEADYLLFEDVKMENENESTGSESSSCCSDYADQQLGPVGGRRKSSWRRRRSTLTEAMDDKQPDIEEVYRRWQEERQCDVLTSTQEDKDSSSSDEDKTDLKRKLEENDSNASNVSKDTSDITPSDQRSSEEAGSSLKESSDCSSKDQKDSSAESETELRTECTLVDSLFVKLPKSMKNIQPTNKHLTLPFWLQEAEHSEGIAKTYQLAHMDIEDILSADRRALGYLSQPPMVLEQIKQLSTIKETENASQNGAAEKSDSLPAVKEGKQEPSFLIDTSVFENLFMPSFGVDSEKCGASQPQTAELSGEELMMLD